MTTTDYIDRLLGKDPTIEASGDGLSLRQHTLSKDPSFMQISVRPFGLLGHVLWLQSETMHAQLDLTEDQVRALAKMLATYVREVLP